MDYGTPEAARQLRVLLEGLGINPNALESNQGSLGGRMVVAPLVQAQLRQVPGD